MRREHLAHTLRALALALLAISLSMALGLQNEPNPQIGDAYQIERLDRPNPTTQPNN